MQQQLALLGKVLVYERFRLRRHSKKMFDESLSGNPLPLLTWSFPRTLAFRLTAHPPECGWVTTAVR